MTGANKHRASAPVAPVVIPADWSGALTWVIPRGGGAPAGFRPSFDLAQGGNQGRLHTILINARRGPDKARAAPNLSRGHS